MTGGLVPPSSSSYIERRADRELLDNLRRGRHCAIVAPRRMGKTSLAANVSHRLGRAGIPSMVVDFGAFETGLRPDQWFLNLADLLMRGLGMGPDARSNAVNWWNAERTASLPSTRFLKFVREVLLPQTGGKAVLIFDELDELETRLGDAAMAAVSGCSAIEGLTIAIAATSRPGFVRYGQPEEEIGHLFASIELTAFTSAEARPLAAELPGDTEAALHALDEILEWTAGHPYLTQALCQAAAETNASCVELLVRDRFGSRTALGADPHLQFCAKVLSDKRAAAVYLRLLAGKPVRHHPIKHRKLLISGLAKLFNQLCLLRRCGTFSAPIPWGRLHHFASGAVMPRFTPEPSPPIAMPGAQRLLTER